MILNDKTSLIEEQVALGEDFVPEKLIHRDRQMREISRCLSPAVNNRKPIHLWLHGRSGSGKTSTARHVLSRLEERYHIDGLLVNCWEKDTFFEILDDIVLQLRILRAEEHRTSLKLKKLRKHLGERPFIVILDEVDRMKPSEQSATIYNLNAIGNVGLICISESRKPLFELKSRVRSRLNPYPVFFPEYSSVALIDILQYRASLALSAGTWSDSALKRIADMAQGDARAAIRTLRNAAEFSEYEHCDRISTCGLQQKWNDARKARRLHTLDSLTQDHRMLYEIIKKEGRILSGDLWKKYSRRCSRIRRKPLASRTFSDYANRLIRAGLISSERARVRGKVRLFEITS
jgi:orc1/cdc6 family replication initiation protein